MKIIVTLQKEDLTMNIKSYKARFRILVLPLLFALFVMPSCFIARTMAINKVVREQEEFSGTLRPVRHDTEIWAVPSEYLFKVKTKLTFEETGNAPRASMALVIGGFTVSIEKLSVNGEAADYQLEALSQGFKKEKRLWIYPKKVILPKDTVFIVIQSTQIFKDEDTVNEDGELNGGNIYINKFRVSVFPESFLIPYAWMKIKPLMLDGLYVPHQLILHTPSNYFATGSGKKTSQIITEEGISTVFTSDQPENWRFTAIRVDDLEKVPYSQGNILGLIDPRAKEYVGDFSSLLKDLADIMNQFSSQLGNYSELAEVQVILQQLEPGFPLAKLDPSGILFLTPEGFLLPQEWNRYGNLAHEAAHQWFGRAILPQLEEDGGVVWIEGIAQYIALEEVRRVFGLEQADMILNGWAANCLNNDDGEKPLATSENEGPGENLAYGKAMLFFYFLAERVGREKFMDSLRQLVQEYQGKGISIEELKQFFAKYFETNLDAYFERWFYQPGIPEEIKDLNAS